MPFLSHLVELRDRLLRAVLSVLLLFLALFYFANDLYNILARPLLNYLPEGSSMVAIDVASPFLTPLKLVFILSIFLAMPYLLYQVWAFVAPALYQHEKRLAMPLMASTVGLFYAGAAFAYFFVFPLVFGFFIGVLPQGVEMATDISRYLDFVLKMFFAFGLAFETPVFIVLLVWAGLVSPQSLAEKRSYIIVIIFIVAMILTPPDVFSQTLLALPMILLFEAGLFMSRLVVKHKAERAAAEDEEYRPLSEEEMDAELARMDAEEKAAGQNADKDKA
jgi:sec-independent protein translocase protein TatC